MNIAFSTNILIKLARFRTAVLYFFRFQVSFPFYRPIENILKILSFLQVVLFLLRPISYVIQVHHRISFEVHRLFVEFLSI